MSAGRVQRAPQLLDLQPQPRDQRLGASSASDRQLSNGPLTGQRKTSSNVSAGLAAMRWGVVENVANLRAGVEHVVISRTSIQIELAEGMVADDQNRIRIIPWTPPSPYRRREIIQGKSKQSSGVRPMKTKRAPFSSTRLATLIAGSTN
jgi:hypothetical protein